MILATSIIFAVPAYLIGVITIAEVHRGDIARHRRAIATWSLVWSGWMLLVVARIIMVILVP